MRLGGYLHPRHLLWKHDWCFTVTVAEINHWSLSSYDRCFVRVSVVIKYTIKDFFGLLLFSDLLPDAILVKITSKISALVFYIVFRSPLLSHYILYHQSPTTISCCCSPFSYHSFQISLNTVLPLHSRSSSPPFPSTFCASDLCQFFMSFYFHKTGPFQPTISS